MFAFLQSRHYCTMFNLCTVIHRPVLQKAVSILCCDADYSKVQWFAYVSVVIILLLQTICPHCLLKFFLNSYSSLTQFHIVMVRSGSFMTRQYLYPRLMQILNRIQDIFLWKSNVNVLFITTVWLQSSHNLLFTIPYLSYKIVIHA